MLLTSFSKHSVLIPRGQSVSAVTGGVEYFREDRQAHVHHPLSYTITGGAARHEKVKPKTWRISASADATWYLRLQVFTTDQPRCYAFDKVLRPPGFYKKIMAFLFSKQNLHEKFFFFCLLTEELEKIMRKCFF